MDHSKLRIGYVPYDATLRHPGDRWRFCYYAKRRGITFEVFDARHEYDLIIVTAGVDLTAWSCYPRGRAKIVFDVIDPYLTSERRDLRNAFGSIAKFLLRHYRHFSLTESRAVERMCRRADAVIGSTVEQKERIVRWCPNVHVILDVHSEDVLCRKTQYGAGEPFKFVWQGLGWSLPTLKVLSAPLSRLASRRMFEVHVITALEFGQYLGGRFGKRRAADVAQGLAPNVVLHQWDSATFARIATDCDLALVPLPLKHWSYPLKPENRLLLFWRLGLPAVVSATPAHVRVMQQAGTPELACRTPQEWEAVLERCMDDAGMRAGAARSGYEYVLREESEAALLARWDAVLESVLVPS